MVVINVLSKQNTGTGNPYQQTDLGGLGSGVLVPEDGYVATAAENILKIQDYVMELPDKTAFNVKILRKGEVRNIRWFK